MNEKTMRRFMFFSVLLTALGTSVAEADQSRAAVAPIRSVLPAAGGRHKLHGIITAISGNLLVVQLRNGRSVQVDATQAIQQLRATELFVSRRVRVYGSYVSGIFEALTIQRARDNAATWPQDN